MRRHRWRCLKRTVKIRIKVSVMVDDNNHNVDPVNDTRTDEELIQVLLSDPQEDEYWNTLAIVQQRKNPATIKKAQELCQCDSSNEKIVGAHILRQGMVQDNKIMPDDCLNTLLALLQNEKDPEVIGEISYALQTYDDQRIAINLVKLSSHPDAELRLAIVLGLGNRNSDPAIKALLELMKDTDDEVRNWATFYVWEAEGFDPKLICDALVGQLDDSYDAVRGEALRGLAKYSDKRVIEPLIHELRMIAEADEWWDYAFEAAENMPDTRLYEALVAARETGIKDKTLDHAIVLCRIPAPEEGLDKLTNAPTSCPVCGLRRAFKKSDNWQYCKRCGWADDPDQRADPDYKDGYNYKSLNQERERWKMRLEVGKRMSRDE